MAFILDRNRRNRRPHGRERIIVRRDKVIPNGEGLRMPPVLETPFGSERIALWWTDLAAPNNRGTLKHENCIPRQDGPGAKGDSLSNDFMVLRRLGRLYQKRVLSMYLRIAPDEVEIERTSLGKPQLSARHESGLTFSFSRAGTTVICAVARRALIGVDLERVRVLMPSLKSFLTKECDEDPPAARPHNSRAPLIRTWTRKEAALKAWGYGLTIDPTEVVLEVDPRIAGTLIARCRTLPAPLLAVHDVSLEGSVIAVAVSYGDRYEMTTSFSNPVIDVNELFLSD